MRKLWNWLWEKKNWWLLPVGIVSVILSEFANEIFVNSPPGVAFLGGLVLAVIIPWLLISMQKKDTDEKMSLGEGFDTVSLLCSDGQWQEIPVSEIITQTKKSVPQAQEKFSGQRIRFRDRVMAWENDEITLYGLPINIRTATWRKADPYAAMTQKAIHPGDVITVTGTIRQMRRTYFYIDDVETLEKEIP